MRRVSFAQARAIAATADGPSWPTEFGTFWVAENGFEDERYWRVLTGSREDLVDENPDFLVVGRPATLVDKQTGEVVHLPIYANLDRLDAMTPVHPASRGEAAAP